LTMTLPASDVGYLESRGITYEVTSEAGLTCVILPDWPLPFGYEPEKADLLVQLTPQYPDVPPDMWWFDPAVGLKNGETVPNADMPQSCCGRIWQRWSRHLQPGQWRSGVDGLESYLALIRTDLERYVPRLTA